MKILEHRALRGPNRYSRYQAIFMLLDIGEYEQQPSDKLNGFADRLIELIPTLQNHGCSIGRPGGFIERLRRGTWIGHIAEHVALELQCLAGMEVGFGKTYDTKDDGIYKVVYRYRVESAGLRAGQEAVALVHAVAQNRSFDIDTVITQLKELRESDLLGPSTNSIVEEAKLRGIPAIRLNNDSHVQLGYGCKQRHIQATMTDRTSAIGVEIADEKFRTKELLGRAGIPTPEGKVAISLVEAAQIANDLGYPVAVKPEVGNHGRGITARVIDDNELETAFASACRICSSVIVEKTMTGFDFRVLVINGVLVAAALREPAHIVGDGKSTIGQLINQVNLDPRRGIGHERVLTAISIDHMTQRLLAFQGRSVDYVLPLKEKLYLKSTANLSTGGTACDVTDNVHQDVRLMCERVARIIGMDCIGIDIVAPGLDQPLQHGSAGIVEVNAAPGFRMHLAPTEGNARNVAEPFVDMLFPPELDNSVPIIAVTGTNGKTTTAKLIAHTLKYSGRMVGFAGTTGVAIDGVPIVDGDYSGPEGSNIVLREPTIDHAVLEIARGGVIRRGLGFDSCDVGILLNVDEDHIGVDGVEDLEELSLVKATVIEVVKDTGVSVLNADDPTVVGLQNRAGGQVIYFSLQPKNEIITRHLDQGGTAAVLQDGDIVIHSPEPTIHVLSVLEAPITMSGAARFNIANVLAAVAALHGLGLSVDMIRNGISTFHPSASQNPGRMNLIDFVTFKVIVDYGHNTPAVKAMGSALPHITKGRKIVVAHGTGSRLDEDIKAFGAALSDVYDHIIVADADPRGRELGETSELVRSGALHNGFAPGELEIVNDPTKALARAFSIVQPGDLIVVQVDEVEPMLKSVMEYFELIAGTAPIPLP
ncbi:cyanophycin synthetase [Pararhizobium sp. IMCC21322]|uniref:cyanophycin synthetase n=1 Tax=Pararhizobium sp. IMCC21322 TaxID=3067903 RepID=UPI002741A9A4|nr:cyanophycin synthetase [Pararhizobium sp. IMCC21322]